MDAVPEYSLFLMRILEELDTKYTTVSYQDLCKSLCARFDLVHLAKLRSLLFYTACLDPSFPATLFRDKMRCSVEDHQSKKLMVAADIVTMFNLIQMNGGNAKDKLPVGHRPKFHKNQSFESCRSDTEVYKYAADCDKTYDFLDVRGHRISRNSPGSKSDCNNCQSFIPTSDPNFLLGVNKDLKCRAASLDKLQHLPQYSSSSSPPCEMQSTYFPMDIDSESTTDQDSLHMNSGVKEVFITNAEPFTVHSCVQKRNIFKEDFHNLVAFSPKVIASEAKVNLKPHGDHHHHHHHGREYHKPATFFNHSFELPYSNPYFEPVSSPVPEKKRVKHESLDDLQASTYFGPTTVSECVNTKRTSAGKQGRQPHWPVKSLSLNTEEGPDFERSFLGSKPPKDNHRHNINSMDNDHKPYQCAKEKANVSPSGFPKKSNGPKTKDMASMACVPNGDKRDGPKRHKDKSVNCTSFQAGNIDSALSVGTQTEQSEQRKLKDYSGHSKYADRQPFKHSDEDSEIISDDISDIFRFLDDMSVCESLGVVQPSCYNSNGSLSQVTKSDGDSSPERNTIRLAKSGLKLDRLFQSLENDDELKASVCKLVLRIGEIEKKLESLSGVRGEISQVLSKLNKLDEKIQEPEANGKPGEAGVADQMHMDAGLSPHVFQCHTTGHNVKVDSNPEWCCSEAGGSDSLRVKALKKSLFTRRSSRSLNEENSATESKVASITNSPRDWRTVSYSSHPGEEGKEKDRESKDRHRKSKETDRQYEVPSAHRSSKPPKDAYLVEQVFSPHHFPPSVKSHKGSPLYTDLRLTNLSEAKRGQPSWTIEEYKRNSGEKGKLAALDLQTQESLNPNNLEYWMEDIYTPGYDSLLKRKEAEFRRAKVCKIGALIAAAACTVILVIVVPICTMKS
ncbi:major intrinsically disordered Notch2-binding receptor 1 [Alosa pseudoharengus]|uniref:major intrinsically disordered Notch2-binding receptor 1 n=1 Tax=Alosa pseudoharengus TaxID=34774 RepID=UPI003F8ABFE2